MAIASLVSGILIDTDHVIDYIIEYGLRFDVKDFFRSCYERRFRRALLILHAWELLAVMGAAAWLTRWNPWVVGLLAGYGQHMVLDQIGNRPHALGYFLLWRNMNKFVLRRTFPGRAAGETDKYGMKYPH